jgi:hypothetical protein
MKLVERLGQALLLLAGSFTLWWGYSLALLWLVPCNNEFHLGTRCGWPVLLIYGGWGLLGVGAIWIVVSIVRRRRAR